jgi:hypothetical protein
MNTNEAIMWAHLIVLAVLVRLSYKRAVREREQRTWW